MLPNWLSFIIFLTVPIAIAISGVYIVRRFVATDVLRRHNEIAIPIHAAISVIYAVLLAFVTVIVWEQYNNTEEAVSREANLVASIDRDVYTFPAPLRNEIHTDLTNYVNSVINEEWELMRKGKLDGYVNKSYQAIWNSIQSFNPKDDHERNWLNLVYQQLNKLDETRSNRLLYAEREIPRPIWGLLIFAGLITLLFSCFFGAEKRDVHIYMTSTLGVVIGIMLFIIDEIDRPFIGIVSLDPEAFHHTLKTLMIVN